MRSIRELRRHQLKRRAHSKGETTLDYPPLEIWIEPTNHCNLKCVKCPHSIGLRRPKGFMEYGLFTKLVDEIADYAFTVSLHLGGESLIHKELPAFIEHADSHGLRTVLHTNATLLTPERCRALVRSGLSLISFSIDGEDKDTYEAMDTGANFERTMAGVAAFMKEKRAARSRTPFTVVQMLTEAPTAKSLRAPETLMNLGADYVQIAGLHAWSGDFLKDSDDPTVKGFEALRNQKEDYAPCHNLWYGMSVLWDGSVSPCCMDMEGDYYVGSVQDSSLLDLWNSEPMVKLRRLQVEGRYAESSLCHDCAYLWGKSHGSMLKDLKGMVKQSMKERYPRVAHALGVSRWGVRDWNA